MNAKGTKGFFIWLQRNMPRTYKDVQRELRTAGQLSGFGATDLIAQSSEVPITKSLAQTIQDIATIAAQGYLTKKQIDAQQDILKMQLLRAQQGLPMEDINLAQYGLQPSVGVGVTPETKQLLIWGAVGLGAVYLFGQMGRSRR